MDLVDNHHIHGILYFRVICYSVAVTHKPHSAGDYDGRSLSYPSELFLMIYIIISLIPVLYLASSLIICSTRICLKTPLLCCTVELFAENVVINVILAIISNTNADNRF